MHVKYTSAYVCLPKIDQDYNIRTWCPRTVKKREGRSFSLQDPRDDSSDLLRDAINTESYNGSIWHDFYSEKKVAAETAGILPDDRLILRGKKPLFKRIDKSLSLNFEGRVKRASRKNIQIVSATF